MCGMRSQLNYNFLEHQYQISKGRRSRHVRLRGTVCSEAVNRWHLCTIGGSESTRIWMLMGRLGDDICSNK